MAHATEVELTGTEALIATMDALRILLANLDTTENQESQNVDIAKLEAQIVRIRGEIQVEKEKLAEAVQQNLRMANFTTAQQGRNSHADRYGRTSTFPHPIT